ncbi:MAG: hypothetical protein ACRDLK_10425, partial [Gaiellaceae bacterium]
MKLAILTHAEHPDLLDTMPSVWPAYMRHDPVLTTFWSRLYELYADFQLWVVDRDARRATVGYACTLPVHWDAEPSP